MSRIALIDLENAPNTSKMPLSEFDELVVFKGPHQHKLALRLHNFSGRITSFDVDDVSHNNLDFHLVLHLGEMHFKHSIDDEFVIISGDKGFDGVIKHLHQQGRPISRLNPNQKVDIPKGASKTVLRKLPPKCLAKTLPKLCNQIGSQLAISDDHTLIEREVAYLTKHKLISVDPDTKTVDYHLHEMKCTTFN